MNIDKFSLLRKSAFCTFLFAFVLVLGLHAQEAKVPVLDFKDIMSEKASRTSQSVTVSKNEIKSLIVDLQPTLYIKNGKEKRYGDTAPIRLNIDGSALSAQAWKNKNLKEVEVVIIKLQDDNSLYSKKINMNAFDSLPKLKYIFVQCGLNCNENNIRNMIDTTSNKYVVIFNSGQDS